MFNIQFENDQKEKSYAWQNSWGLTTRSIGTMIMVHGDDKGLVLPPRIAPFQVVIVPIFFKDKDNEAIVKRAKEIIEDLANHKIRGHLDERDTYNPGWKYNHWELKGVPVRLDFGPKDLEKNVIVVVRRDKQGKETVPLDKLASKLTEILDDIHNNLLAKATKERDERIAKVTKWEDFVPALDAKKMVLAPFCNETKCEDDIKAKSGKKELEKKRRIWRRWTRSF